MANNKMIESHNIVLNIAQCFLYCLWSFQRCSSLSSKLFLNVVSIPVTGFLIFADIHFSTTFANILSDSNFEVHEYNRKVFQQYNCLFSHFTTDTHLLVRRFTFHQLLLLGFYQHFLWQFQQLSIFQIIILKSFPMCKLCDFLI